MSTKKIGTYIFSIEDEAYNIFENYINKLKLHFGLSEDAIFKINTIENDIAKLLNQNINDGATTISKEQITEAINKVGSAESFGATANEQNTTNPNYNFTNRKKRLYKTGNDKIIAGVCGGIANYLNVDPVFVRVVALLTCVGGVGIIAYIIATIVLPKSYDVSFSGKRIYRDTNNKVIAGVCSGLANYLNIDVLYARLIFVLPIIFGIVSNTFDFNGNFSFSFGFLYLALVIIMPKKYVTNNFTSNYGATDGANINPSTNTSSAGTSTNAYNTNNNTTYAYQQPMQHSGLGDLIVTLFKTFFLFIAGFIAIALAFSFLGIFIGGLNLLPYTEYLIKQENQMFLAQSGWILTFLTPIIWLAVLIYNKISRAYTPSYVHYGALVAFVIGLVSLVYFVTDVASDFKISNEQLITDSTSNISSAKNLEIKIMPFNTNYIKNKWKNFEIAELYNDSALVRNVVLNYVPSFDSNYHVSVKKFSYGKNISDVDARLNQLKYDVQLKDSVLYLPAGFILAKGQVWRGQQIVCTVFIPTGKRIFLPENLNKNVYNIKFKTYGRNSYDWGLSSNPEDDNRWYQMKDGALKFVGEGYQSKYKALGDDGDTDFETDITDASEEVKQELKDASEEIKTELENAGDEIDAALNNENNNTRLKISVEDSAKAIQQLRSAKEKLNALFDKLEKKVTVKTNSSASNVNSSSNNNSNSATPEVATIQQKLIEAQEKLKNLQNKIAKDSIK